MAEYKEGHRKRIKQKYLNNKNNLVNDYEILELLLTYAIPRIDVKPAAKELLNTFGSLDNVLNAGIKSLSDVKGIGENTAILINLVKEINLRANKSKNNKITKFTSLDVMLEYFKNILSMESNEKIIVVTLDNSNRIIASREVTEGTANFSAVNPRKILEGVLADNASGVVVAHNHPKGEAEPSAHDIDFTLKVRDLLKTINVKLFDHIIVGENGAFSMQASIKFSAYFR